MSMLSAALGTDANHAGDDAFKAAQGYLGNISGIANGYGGLAASAGQDYGIDNTGYRHAAQGYEDALGRGFGDSDRAAYIAQQTAPAMAAYQQGGANLTAQLAARGLGDSGAMAGGLANLEGMRAGAVANAGASANNYFTQANLARHQQLTGLLGGMAQTDYGRQTGAMGAQAGLDQFAAGTYQQIGQQQYQNKAQQNAALANDLGGVASLVGQAYGMGGMGGRSKQSNPYGAIGGGWGGGLSYAGDGSEAYSPGGGYTYTGLQSPGYGALMSLPGGY